MRALSKVIGLCFAAAALNVPVFAQEHAEPAPPEPSVTPLALSFSNEGLSGPGADQLRAHVENSQFIAIGEDHGFADAPVLLSAFAAEGADHGFDTYAVETGPWSADWVRDRLNHGGVDGYASDLAGRPLAIPFLSMREEADVAAQFLGDGQLWGIDQEFIGSPLIHLEWFADRLGGSEAGQELRSWLDTEKSAFATGNQQAIFMASADQGKWDRLREMFAGDTDASERIDALERSQSIYMANFSGRGFDNNTDRVALIREYFLKNWTAAQADGAVAPRVLFKMGAVHIGRGTSPMKTFDIGSLLEGVAAANGMEILRVAYLPVGGEQLSVRPSSDGAFSVVPVSRGAQLAVQMRDAGVDMDVVREGEGHYIIDLEPVRRAMGNKGLNDADGMFRFVVLGFDYLVTTNTGKAGTPLAER
ncbi:MAG: hypothetical protein ABJ205_13965 [Erythrobacter sp.]|uniref:hypothetical protein n=1 Tax=Erythrobacter sp. TaxID=1042 RepID=UPI0032645051